MYGDIPGPPYILKEPNQQTEVSFFSKTSFKFSLKTLYFHIFVYETQNFVFYTKKHNTQNTCTLHTNTDDG